MISASHIIDAGVEYIERPKVTGKAAVDKYLTATNEFFKAVIFPEWPSCPLSVVGNFKEYRDNIINKSNKSLKSYEPRQHLDKDGYENLLKYLVGLGDDSLRNRMAKDQRPNSDYFDTIIKNFNKMQGRGRKITLDGLAKFAVINMFYIGMDPIVIGQVTGMKDVVLKYCQQEAWKKRKEDLKTYVNSKFRSIVVYDNFND